MNPRLLPPLVIYHSGCRDGWCAAWVVHRKYPDAEFFPGYYGQDPPNVVGRNVIITDFSYPLSAMQQIAGESDSLTVLDHHATAQEALASLRVEKGVDTVTFDMDRSGAGLAWDHFFPGQPRPWLVNYVEDRDLWRHKLPSAYAISAYVGVIPFTFEDWDKAEMLGAGQAAELGAVVEAKVHQYIKEVEKNAERINFEGYDVPIVNAPQVDISELVGHMANGEKFAMGWWRGHGVFNYSLRSKGDFDVSALAKKYGGGGHKNAAGFQSKKLILIGGK